jgi:hypothetical protein
MAAKAVSVSPRLQGISRGEGMKSQQAFIEAARGIAELIQGRAEALEPEIRQTEARLREMEAERQAARDTPERLTNFTPMVGGNYQCPFAGSSRKRDAQCGPSSATQEATLSSAMPAPLK